LTGTGVAGGGGATETVWSGGDGGVIVSGGGGGGVIVDGGVVVDGGGDAVVGGGGDAVLGGGGGGGGGVVVDGGGGVPHVTVTVAVSVRPALHSAKTTIDPGEPWSTAVSDEMSAEAVPAPTKFGGLSTAATLWVGPPSTDTWNEIGWSVAAKSEKLALACVQSALMTCPVWAPAVPANRKTDDTMSTRTEMAKRGRRMETPAVVQATPRIDARVACATAGNEKRAAVQQRPSGASRRRPPDLTVLTGTNCPRRRSPVGGALHCSGTYRCRVHRARESKRKLSETVRHARKPAHARTRTRATARTPERQRASGRPGR
jgi:hypothetical protein